MNSSLNPRNKKEREGERTDFRAWDEEGWISSPGQLPFLQKRREREREDRNEQADKRTNERRTQSQKSSALSYLCLYFALVPSTAAVHFVKQLGPRRTLPAATVEIRPQQHPRNTHPRKCWNTQGRNFERKKSKVNLQVKSTKVSSPAIKTPARADHLPKVASASAENSSTLFALSRLLHWLVNPFACPFALYSFSLSLC